MTPIETSEKSLPVEPTDILRLTRAKLSAYARALRIDKRRVVLASFAIIVGWLATGFFRVQPEELGIVTRFSRIILVSSPGLHFRLPYPIDKVLLTNVTRINQLQVGHVDTLPTRRGNLMLTGDENIVDADCAIFWRVKDPVRFAFALDDPDRALGVLADSAVREVVGRNPIQSPMSDRRQQIADDIQALLQRVLDDYDAGIAITQVQLQRVDPPSAVIDDFNDVQRARADQERARNEAAAYRNDVTPRARAEANRIVREAEAYKSQATSVAEGDTQGFISVYNAFRLSPDVTSWRMYLDSLDELLRKASKVIIDSNGKGVSSTVPYLPLVDSNLPPERSRTESAGSGQVATGAKSGS